MQARKAEKHCDTTEAAGQGPTYAACTAAALLSVKSTPSNANPMLT
jgi:hypothetical protein